MRIKVLDRQALHATEHLFTKLIKISLCHYRHDLCLDYRQDQSQNIHHKEDDKIAYDLGTRCFPCHTALDTIDDDSKDLLKEDRGSC